MCIVITHFAYVIFILCATVVAAIVGMCAVELWMTKKRKRKHMQTNKQSKFTHSHTVHAAIVSQILSSSKRVKLINLDAERHKAAKPQKESGIYFCKKKIEKSWAMSGAEKWSDSMKED